MRIVRGAWGLSALMLLACVPYCHPYTAWERQGESEFAPGHRLEARLLECSAIPSLRVEHPELDLGSCSHFSLSVVGPIEARWGPGRISELEVSWEGGSARVDAEAMEEDSYPGVGVIRSYTMAPVPVVLEVDREVRVQGRVHIESQDGPVELQIDETFVGTEGIATDVAWPT